MATAHLPSILPTHSFTPFDPLKTEKYLNEEHEYEISKWLKLENEPLPGLGGNSFISASDLTSSSLFSAPSQLPTLQPEFSTNYPSSFNFSATTNTGAPQSAQLPPSNQTSHIPANSQPQYTSAPYSYPVYHHSSQQYPTQYQTIQYTTSANQGQQYATSQTQQYATAQQTQYSNVQYSSTSGGAYASQFSPATGQYATATQYTTAPYQFLQPSQYSNSAQQQYAQSIVPAQIFQPQYATVAPSNGNYQPTQFQYLVYQHQMMKTPQADDLTEDKKRKQVRPFPRRVRQTRPKVVEAKGAVQCKGRNRKKGTQCRNAALMEYIGPRPIYCAEHIELDPKSLYEKCKSSYQKEPGDNKGCKEVVLKEFGVCYKHYPDLIQEMIENREYEKTRKHSERVSELLTQLEKDAAAAKKKDGDLYQRKNKLIPKFQEMKKLINRALEAIESYRHKDFSEVLPSELAHLSTPIVLDGLSVHIVETFTSSEDEDLLSSPHSDSSLEEEFEQILS